MNGTQDMEVDYQGASPFYGANGPSQQDPTLWHCSRCSLQNPLWSWFAYVDKGTMNLAKCPDVQVQRAIEGGKFTNSYTDGVVDLVCCRCCAAANGKEAEWLKEPGGGPTNKWVRLARDTKERPAEAKRAQFILNRLDEKRAKTEPMNMKSVEVFDALMKSKELRKSTDWCTILGPWCCFFTAVRSAASTRVCRRIGGGLSKPHKNARRALRPAETDMVNGLVVTA